MRPQGGLAVVSALALAACGAGAGRRAMPSGSRVFARSCAGCHTLSSAEAPSKQGGSLLPYRMSRREFIEFAREMPTRRRLTAAELAAVTGYVRSLERRAGQ